MTIAYAAFLRGINVGGHRKLPMAELRSAMEGLGFAEVATYVASGNLVFSCAATDRSGLTASIETLIADTWGYRDVPVVLRTHAELAEAFAASPHLDSGVEPKHRFLALLSAPPDRALLAATDFDALSPDVFTVEGDHAHVLLRTGAAKSKLTTNYLEKKLGVITTLRNHNTVAKVISLLDDRS